MFGVAWGCRIQSSHTRRALVGSRQFICMGQNILSVYLVVQQVEAIFRFVLRLAIQLDLKFPNVARCCQTHRQSPHLSFFTSTPEVRALSSAGITGLISYMALSDSQTGRGPFRPRLEPRPPPVPSLPQLPRSPSLHAVLTTPVDRDKCLLVSSLPARPSPFFRRVGIHIV